MQRRPRPLSKSHSAILDQLVDGLVELGSGHQIDNKPGLYMAVNVDRLGERLFAVSHRFEQNGDLVPDPEIVFYRDEDGAWLPYSVTYAIGRYEEVLVLDGDAITGWRPRAYSGLRDFARLLLSNIKAQQGDLTARAVREAA